MMSTTFNWVNRAEDSSKFNPTIAVQGKIYRNIGALIPPQQIKQSYTSVCVHGTD